MQLQKNNLQKLFDDFINECRFSMRLRPETIRGYKAVFSLFKKIMPEIDITDTLSTPMLNEFLKRIEERQRIVGRATIKTGVKDSTIKTYWTKLNVFFAWLYKKDFLDKNPLDDIKPPRVSYDDFKRLEDSEINKLYSAIVLHPISSLVSRRDTLIISLFIYTGMRKGEFLGLKVNDIDLYKKQITIRGETSKSKKTRTLFLNPTLFLHLKDYFTERNKLGCKSEYLIVSSKRDSKLTEDGLIHWVKRLNKLSGVKFHLHQFRHTFACKITENGTPSLSLQKLMGHDTISMTSKYTRSLKAQNMIEDIEGISY